MKLILSARDSRELADELLLTILKSSLERKYTFGSIFCGLLANMIGTIPDDVWDKMVEEAGEHCGKIDCDCHVIGRALFDALDRLRDDWKLNKPLKLDEDKD